MFFRSIAVAAAVLGLFACAGSEPSSDPASDQSDFVGGGACGTAAYAAANTEYKKAVATAKQHKIDACIEENADLGTIARQAAAATKSCAAFGNVIKTSPWAAPIREELKGTLVLAQLTGDLKIKDASGKTVFTGLEAALSQGVTLWGPAAGVYGNHSKIEFGANGAAKIMTMNEVGNDGKVTWTTLDASYKVGAVSGDAAKITITQGATVADFELRSVSPFLETPDFELRAIGGNNSDVFTAFISECEA